MANAKFLKNNKWIVGNEEDGGGLWALGLFPKAFYNEFPKYSSLPNLYNMVDFKQNHFRLIVPSGYWQKVGNKILQRVIKNPLYFKKLSGQLYKSAREMYAFGRKIKQINPGHLSDAELLKIFRDFEKCSLKMIGIGLISTLSDLPHPQFTTHIENLLAARVKKLNLSKLPAEYFHILSSLTENTAQRVQYLDLLKLVIEVKKSRRLAKIFANKKDAFTRVKSEKEFWIKITSHTQKFCWVNYNYHGPAFTEKWLVNEIYQSVRNTKAPERELKTALGEIKTAPKKIKLAEKELKLSTKEKSLFGALRYTSYMKVIRRDALTYAFYEMEKFLKAFAKRVNISLLEARYLAPGEQAQAIKKDGRLLSGLKSRTQYCVYAFLSNKPQILSGKRAEKLVGSYFQEEKIIETSELKGQIACIGKAVGKVKIVNLAADMRKMNKGDILVSIATAPELVPAMKKAAAIVTEQGGITSHAAIVSRELGIPCVIGTKIATKIFKDGDMVEVDANKGIVKKLN